MSNVSTTLQENYSENAVIEKHKDNTELMASLRSAISTAKYQQVNSHNQIMYRFYHELLRELDNMNPDNENCRAELENVRRCFETRVHWDF